MDKYVVKNKRLSKYLYSLGFDREIIIDMNGNEQWLFDNDDLLNKALDFYFYMRKQNRNK